MGVTLQWIADKAGVTKSAVSRVLNNKDVRVSSETRKRIIELALEYDYTSAYKLRNSKSNIILLVLPSIEVDFFAGLIETLEKECVLRGYSILVRNTHEDINLERQALSLFRTLPIAGMLVAATDRNSNLDLYGEMNDIAFPYVHVDRHIDRVDGQKTDYVTSDNVLGSKILTSLLIDKGHTRITYLYHGKAPFTSINNDRHKGYSLAMSERGLSLSTEVILDCPPAAQPFRRMMESAERPTAAIISGSWDTYNVLGIMHSLGYVIPDDLEIAMFDTFAAPYSTYDEIQVARVIRKPILIAKQNVQFMAKIAMEMLLQKIDSPGAINKQIMIAPSILNYDKKAAQGGMTGRQRLDAIMSGKGCEQPGLMCQIGVGHLIKHSNMPPAEFFMNYNKCYTETLIRLTREYCFDGMLVEYPGFDTSRLARNLARVEDIKGGQRIHWKDGGHTDCMDNAYPAHYPAAPPVRRPLQELFPKDLEFPPTYKYSSSMIEPFYLEPYKMALALAGDDLSIHGFTPTPFSYLCVTYGVEDALILIMDDPKHLKLLLDEVEKASMQWVDNLIDIGIHAICISAPYEGEGFISIAQLKEFCAPYTRRIARHVRKRGRPSYIHMCGKINDRLEAIMDMEVDGIECLDPPPIGNVTLKDAVGRLGGNIFIKGNVDPVNTLLRGTPEQVYDDAAERLRCARGNNRFILSTACSVAPDTAPENLKALSRAISEYGGWEINESP